MTGRAPESILDTWAAARREKWLSFTNRFSIENKRMVQRAGYSEDPLGIWKQDEVSKAHEMDRWVQLAIPEREQEDLAMYRVLENKQEQLAIRMKQWDITMDPLWMAEYEDTEVVAARVALRPVAKDLKPRF
jgi:hypothetical protein